MAEQKKKGGILKIIILALIVIGIILLFVFTDIGSYLKETLIPNLESLVIENYLLTVVIFVGVYIAVVSLSLPFGSILTATSGVLFGTVFGALWVNLGATAGALILFLLVRYLIGDRIQEKYADKLSKLNKEIDENGSSYFLMVRFVPVFPFWLINLLAGMSKVKFFTYFWTTALGILPGSLVYAYLGQALKEAGKGTPWQVFVAFGLLGLLSVVPVVIKKISAAKKAEVKK